MLDQPRVFDFVIVPLERREEDEKFFVSESVLTDTGNEGIFTDKPRETTIG